MTVYGIYVDYGEGKPELYSEILYIKMDVANEKIKEFHEQYKGEVKFFIKPFDVE